MADGTRRALDALAIKGLQIGEVLSVTEDRGIEIRLGEQIQTALALWRDRGQGRRSAGGSHFRRRLSNPSRDHGPCHTTSPD